MVVTEDAMKGFLGLCLLIAIATLLSMSQSLAQSGVLSGPPQVRPTGPGRRPRSGVWAGSGARTRPVWSGSRPVTRSARTRAGAGFGAGPARRTDMDRRRRRLRRDRQEGERRLLRPAALEVRGRGCRHPGLQSRRRQSLLPEPVRGIDRLPLHRSREQARWRRTLGQGRNTRCRVRGMPQGRVCLPPQQADRRLCAGLSVRPD